MLEKLTIRNIALIDREEIGFAEGLNVLSGETGAGKSIILDSIDFVLGAKADKSLIRYGCEDCFVRAEFRLGEDSSVRNAIDELDLDGGEGDVLVLSRRFTQEGKSTIKVNGTTVTASMLRKITSCLVDVHGQSEHFWLLKESNQMQLLDGIAGSPVSEGKKSLSALLAERKELLEKISALGGDEGERSRKLDVLRFQIEELESAELAAGEEDSLLTIRNRIAHSEKILSGLSVARQALSSDGAGIDAIITAQNGLSPLAKYDEKYSELAERLESLYSELYDISETVEEYAGELELDQNEIDRVESRLDEIKRLKKKYGGSVEAAIAFLDSAKQEYELLSDSGEKLQEFQRELEKLNGKIYKQCRKLTEARKKAAASFSERVTKELKSLNISSARFEVQFDDYSEEDVDKAGKDGLDRLRFLFSANAGEPLKEMGKIISGGEMSRFMLAIKAQLSEVNRIGTYIFDEIDAGISGKTAKVVGEKFAQIARNTQIIAVSHLAQIASMADRQFLIEKVQETDKTHTTIKQVEGEKRVREISRLTGGEESEAALSHARELLEQAQTYKRSLLN